MSSPADIVVIARRLLAEGRAAEALASVEHAAAQDDEAAFTAAKAEEALGRYAQARERLIALRSRLPRSTAPLEIQLGILHDKLGDKGLAIAAMEAAATLKPDLVAGHKNLVALLVAAGKLDEARAAMQRAVSANPYDATLWVSLSSLETQRGDADAAMAALGKAVLALPVDAATWREIAYAYSEYWKYPEADRALALASALDPGEPRIETHRAFVKQELGDTAGARAALQAAVKRSPEDLQASVAERLLLPQVYADAEDVARWRARYTQGLEDLERRIDTWLPRAAEVFDLNHNNFLLAYQGADDRELQRRYSAFLGSLVGRARPEWRERRPVTFSGQRRLRIGFVGSLFRDCTAGRYFERWVTSLDAGSFERYIYHASPIIDAVTRRIAESADHFVPLRVGPREIASRIDADQLDVLVQPEVGMNAITYVLAASRLAPVQCAGWGHPVTTGSETMDLFFTSGPMEPPDGESHYVERLVRLPGLGVNYSMPAPQPPVERSKLGLPEDRRLYACAQSVFKVHPDMDELLADVIARDPDGVLVFFQAMGRHATENLAARLQRAFAQRGIQPRGQLKFLPRMESGYFRRVLAAADVVLDTVHWSGGNTSIDAFAAGAPVVTLPGRFMRGRQTAGMLELMGMPELIAPSAEEYVRIAVEAAADRERNAALRHAIAERRAVLFDQRAPVDAFAQALLQAGSGRPA